MSTPRRLLAVPLDRKISRQREAPTFVRRRYLFLSLIRCVGARQVDGRQWPAFRSFDGIGSTADVRGEIRRKDMSTQYWDSAERSRTALARLAKQAQEYLVRFPGIKLLYEKANRARDRIGNPRFSRRAWLVLDKYQISLDQFYGEFGAFAKEVLAAFEDLRDVLLVVEVDGFQRKVRADRIQPTCEAVLSAQQRLEEFWNARPGQLLPPLGQKKACKKPGPKPKIEEHRKVAKVILEYGENWRDEPALTKIAAELDKQSLPVPKSWAKRKPPSRTWARGVQSHPRIAIQALEYRQKMGSR